MSSKFIPGDFWLRADGGKAQIAFDAGVYLLVDVFSFMNDEEGLPVDSRMPYTPDGKCLVSWTGVDKDFTLVEKIKENADTVPASV